MTEETKEIKNNEEETQSEEKEEAVIEEKLEVEEKALEKDESAAEEKTVEAKEVKKPEKKMNDSKMTFRTVVPQRPKNERREERVKEFEEKVLEIARVARVVKGGRRFKFRAAVVIGNKNGKVGIGIGKGSEVQDAVRKAVSQAKKVMVEVNIKNQTIPADIESVFKGARVLLKPAPKGAGIIAGGAVRAVVDCAGISNISSKMLGSQSKINNMTATFNALKSLTELKDK